jgi:translation initiation factor IF-2
LAATRVYILAKELGVKSSAIVKKCQDEGLDVKNHMSAISAGLAATIREWFSEGENITTVETTKKVDLKKVRLKPKRKKVKKAAKAKKTDVKPIKSTKPTETSHKQPIVMEDKGDQKPPKAVVLEPGKESAEAEVALEQQQPPEEKIVEKHRKTKPEPILPAGPILEKPKPAKLSGPTVIRVEAPEPLRRPKPRPRPRFDAPVTEPLMYSKDEKQGQALDAGEDKKRFLKRQKDRTHGRRRQDEEAEPTKKSRFRSKWRQRDIEERQARLNAAGGEGLRSRPARKIATKAKHEAAVRAKPQKAAVYEPITVKELSTALAVKSSDIVSKLMEHKIMATANQIIGNDIAELIALEFDTELIIEYKKSIEEQIREEFEKRERKHLKKRAVVAAMLGHVDHGKTSLLDKIRSTRVAAGEAGGITQHIGASQVSWDTKTVTFIDTPGHEAFTAMRARGANMTDVVVLTVAADDGVMPQTVEAIAHSKAAGVPIIVALNKIDLPGCDTNRIYSQLAEHDLTPTEWGGNTELVKTSAVTGEGIDDLLECLDYVAELLELKADDTIPATGWVVEAKLSPQQGPVATLLIKEGQLSKGDIILAGCAYGRVKMLRNSYGKSIKTATSSMPVEVMGLSDVPQAC